MALQNVDIEYIVRVVDNNGKDIERKSFANETDADTYARNAGTGEGYRIIRDEIDWLEIKMEKYRNDY